MLRVATYNIQKSIGLDARRRPHRILDVIAEIGADVVALQEVDRRFGTRAATLPRHAIVERTGLQPVDLGAEGPSLGWHGNALLVGPSIRVLATRRLALPTLEPRGAIAVRIETGGVALRVVAAHLSLVGHFRRRQIGSILEAVEAEDAAMPTVMMGDLNEWFRSSSSIRALHPRLALAETGPSFPAPAPVARLDRIGVSRDLAIGASGVHRSRMARIASDHLPVWADLAPAG